MQPFPSVRPQPVRGARLAAFALLTATFASGARSPLESVAVSYLVCQDRVLTVPPGGPGADEDPSVRRACDNVRRRHSDVRALGKVDYRLVLSALDAAFPAEQSAQPLAARVDRAEQLRDSLLDAARAVDEAIAYADRYNRK